jgi:polyisoprenyl-phosphate glycosyltransferase
LLAAPSRPLVSIVCPCLDEEAVLPAFLAELERVLATLDEYEHEIILVDDGSRDGTLPWIEQRAASDPRLRVVAFSRNFGHQAALSAGLEAAHGDAIVLMDSDLQHPPALLPVLLARWREGNDIVSTIRKTSGGSRLEALSSRAFYRLVNLVSEVRIEPAAADFCLVSRRVRDVLVAMPERHRMLRGLLTWVGFRRAFVEFDAAPRAAGRSRFGWRKRFAFALDGILGFSVAPIRLAIWTGGVVAALGGVYLAYVIARALGGGPDVVPGWASLISVVLILGGLQLVFVGILGTYVARVFEQTKGRPLYVLRRDVTPPRERT